VSAVCIQSAAAVVVAALVAEWEVRGVATTKDVCTTSAIGALGSNA